MPLFCTSQSLGKAPPAPLESILVNSQNKTSLNFHADCPLASSCRTYGEVMTDEQPLIMRMIFHLLWLISLGREWHLGSHLSHIFMYKRVMFLFLTSYFSHSFFLSWKQTHTECHVLLIETHLWGWCWRKLDVHWGSLESFSQESRRGFLEIVFLAQPHSFVLGSWRWGPRNHFFLIC